MPVSARMLAFLLALGLGLPAAAAAGPPFGPPRAPVLFGHIASLKRSRGGYVMRFDPAILLSGTTATDYAFATTGSRDVPNDNLVFDPEHILLDYRVSASAHVTVVVNHNGIEAGRVSVATLVRVLAGTVQTFEPKNPFWIVVRGDTVLELDQQYTP